MNSKDDELLKRLRAAFRQEAEERLHSMSALLVELEKSSESERYLEIAETVFREAHSLKGAARAAGFGEIEKIFQDLESVFAAFKRKQIELSPENFDFLLKAVDTIDGFLSLPEDQQAEENGLGISKLKKQLTALAGTGGLTDRTAPPAGESPKPEDETPAPDRPQITTEDEAAAPAIKSQITAPPADLVNEAAMPEIKSQVTAPPAAPESLESRSALDQPALPSAIRISVDKLDSLMRQAQEMLGVKQIAGQAGEDYQALLFMIEQMMKEWTKLAPETRALRRVLDKEDASFFAGRAGRQSLLDLTDAYEWVWNQMGLLEGRLQTLVRASVQSQRTVGVMVDTLVQDMKKVLMLPFSSFLETVPKLVRDLSRDQGKDVQLIMEGSEVEIDRRILEEMRDPLIHILRNCVDHGLEKPEVRAAQNKPETGTIRVSIKQVNGNKVEIVVADDGVGVQIDKVKEAAVKQGFISGEQARDLEDEAAMSLIFESEISSSRIVTDLSGRGLGLAIVREKVENLGGQIFARSQPGQGAEFRIIIPITLATFRGLLFRIGEQRFIVPTINVEQAVRIKADEIQTVENRETISLSGRTLAFSWLADVLGLPRTDGGDDGRYVTVVVLSTAGKQLAFGLDELINEEEVLLKPLGRQLSRVRNIYGAAILGSGQVVAVLNVADLIKSAAAAPFRSAQVEPSAVAGEKINILVAEDSITSRMLLKNILESAGYEVKTVTDGLEAFTELKLGNYNLLVSDVDMPRMNGFVLTEKVREDKKLADLPVVLVTALQSREDRERGIDTGANAYIVKSSFDQSNLLNVIKKLI